MEAAGAAITQMNFTTDIRSQKEIEFLQLKQGSMIVDNYVAKFEDMVTFCPYYSGVEALGSKCVKFKSGLRLEIKQFIGYQEIYRFLVSVNKCKIYDEDNKARSAHNNCQ